MDALAQIAAQLGLDDTFFFLFGLIIVLYFFLSQAYLKPYQRLLHERKHSIDGVKKEAAAVMARAEDTFASYKERLKSVTHDSHLRIRESEEIARKEESKILGVASANAKAALQNAQHQLEEQHRTAVASLSSEISGLAQQIAEKVLGSPARK